MTNPNSEAPGMRELEDWRRELLREANRMEAQHDDARANMLRSRAALLTHARSGMGDGVRERAMQEALEWAAARFDWYADGHERKGATEKAEANRKAAIICRRALAVPPAAPETPKETER